MYKIGKLSQTQIFDNCLGYFEENLLVFALDPTKRGNNFHV